MPGADAPPFSKGASFPKYRQTSGGLNQSGPDDEV